MSTINLTKSETAILAAAGAREDSSVILPAGTKPVTMQRILGKFLKHGLVAAREADGRTDHLLTEVGYAAAGVAPVATLGSGARATEPGDHAQEGAAPQPSKKALALALLGRSEGATLDELVAATGWLPHTTRAVLSRLRSAGTELIKSTRDGKTAYRIAPEEPAPVGRGRRRRSAASPTPETAGAAV